MPARPRVFEHRSGLAPALIPTLCSSVLFCVDIVGSTLHQQSPTFLAPGASFVEDNFSTERGWGDGFGIIQVRYIYCALYFYYYYIVTYNEIIVQLTIMQNQWEP